MKRVSMIARGTITLVIFLTGLGLTAQPGIAQAEIPPGSVVESATLYLLTAHIENGGTVQVHRITAPWTEMGVTWNSFGGSYDPDIEASFDPDGYWETVDVTTLVQSWVSGVHDNFGLLLKRDLTGFTSFYSSDESSGGRQPKLEVCYRAPDASITCVTIERGVYGEMVDAYIFEVHPDTNYGGEPTLMTGFVSGGEKQSLLWFDLPVIPPPPPPPSACTRTQGYWKTHSQHGPAPYDATWDAREGGDAEFLGTGMSYYDVLWTAPKGGNAYFILAHQYIAAELNKLSGASVPPDVLEALDQAKGLLVKYQGDLEIPKKSSDHQQAIELAELLDDYNNGYIGPGHCSD